MILLHVTRRKGEEEKKRNPNRIVFPISKKTNMAIAVKFLIFKKETSKSWREFSEMSKPKAISLYKKAL